MAKNDATAHWFASVFAVNLIILSYTEGSSPTTVPTAYCQKDTDCRKGDCIYVEGSCECLIPDDYRCPKPSSIRKKQETNTTPTSKFGGRYFSCSNDSECSPKTEVCVMDSNTSCSCMPWDHIRCTVIQPTKVPAVTCKKDADCPTGDCINVEKGSCECLVPADYRCRLLSIRRKKQETYARPISRFGRRYRSCITDSECSAKEELCIADSETSCSCMTWDDVRCPEIKPTQDYSCLGEGDCLSDEFCVQVQDGKCECAPPGFFCEAQYSSRKKLANNSTSLGGRRYWSCDYYGECPSYHMQCRVNGRCTCVPMNDYLCREDVKGVTVVGYALIVIGVILVIIFLGLLITSSCFIPAMISR